MHTGCAFSALLGAGKVPGFATSAGLDRCRSLDRPFYERLCRRTEARTAISQTGCAAGKAGAAIGDALRSLGAMHNASSLVLVPLGGSAVLQMSTTASWPSGEAMRPRAEAIVLIGAPPSPLATHDVQQTRRCHSERLRVLSATADERDIIILADDLRAGEQSAAWLRRHALPRLAGLYVTRQPRLFVAASAAASGGGGAAAAAA
eukprot:7336257-Prymnesium_polylepis.1